MPRPIFTGSDQEIDTEHIRAERAYPRPRVRGQDPQPAGRRSAHRRPRGGTATFTRGVTPGRTALLSRNLTRENRTRENLAREQNVTGEHRVAHDRGIAPDRGVLRGHRVTRSRIGTRRRPATRRRRSVLLAAVSGLLIVGGLVTTTQGLAYLRPRDEAPRGTAAAADGGPATRLVAALDRYLANRPVRVSVAVADRSTGFAAVYHPEQTFQSASIVKINLLAALLLGAQDAARELTTAEQELTTKMMATSDNVAAEAVWQQVGGAEQVAATNRRLGLTATVPDADAWGRTTTTAGDQLRLLTVLLDGSGAIAGSGVTRAREFMSGVAADQSWGISAAAHPGEVVRLKNGWDTRTDDRDRWMVHSVGAIGASSEAITLVVLSDGHASRRAGVDLTQDVAKLVRGALS